MVLVEGGTFTMGCQYEYNCNDDERPARRVYVDDFLMGQHEVTNKQFAAFLNSVGNLSEAGVKWYEIENSDAQIEQRLTYYRAKSGYEDHPVMLVNWFGAVAYCKWLSEINGRSYRLPTEAEWEYVAHRGEYGIRYREREYWDDENWDWWYLERRTRPVMANSPNILDLYGLADNVQEWCSDWYGDYYDSYYQRNPVGPTIGSAKVVRGGLYGYGYYSEPETKRRYADPLRQSMSIGFRVVASLDQAFPNPCGSRLTAEDRAFMGSYAEASYKINIDTARGFTDIPVQFHVVGTDEGQYGISLVELDQALKALNAIYRAANLRFLSYSPPNYINNSYYNDLTSGNRNELSHEYGVAQVMNIYCVDNYWDALSGTLCGIADYPSADKQKNRIFIQNSCMTNGSTFSHEVGHFFGLYHTFQEEHMGKEMVCRMLDENTNEKADCRETGDECCDTPADPNLSRYYLSGQCGIDAFIEHRDPRGDVYRPMFNNLMNYNPNKECRTQLTKDQYARVITAAKRDRSHFRIPEEYLVCDQPIAGKVKLSIASQTSISVTRDRNLFRFSGSFKLDNSFKLKVSNNADIKLNVYVISMKANQEISLMYPDESLGEQPYLKRKGAYKLKKEHTQANKQAGLEHICILYTGTKLDTSALLQNLAYASGNFTQKLYQVLGQQILPADQANYQEGNTISFSACLKENEILPVILEMKWQ